jgi:hypothetical protein
VELFTVPVIVNFVPYVMLPGGVDIDTDRDFLAMLTA